MIHKQQHVSLESRKLKQLLEKGIQQAYNTENNSDLLEIEGINIVFENNYCVQCLSEESFTTVDIFVVTNYEIYYWICSVDCLICYLHNSYCTGQRKRMNNQKRYNNIQRNNTIYPESSNNENEIQVLNDSVTYSQPAEVNQLNRDSVDNYTFEFNVNDNHSGFSLSSNNGHNGK